tara:strand:+ start:218 stop:478 length:261 start_codon:yes stop_codon:yes gene_type:complete
MTVYKIMLKNIQKEVEDLRVKVYSGQSNEDTEKALYEIEQLLFKAMDKQLNLTGVGCSLPSKEEYDQVLEHQFNKISKSKNPLVKN